MPARLPIALGVLAASALLAACGSAAPADVSTPSASPAAVPQARVAAAALRDWPVFGLNPQRTDVTEAATGITASSLGRLSRRRISLPGTVDSSPIYLHGATVAGTAHDVTVVTTTYGRTIAID